MSWKLTVKENSSFKCYKCGSTDVRYVIRESSCGGYDDYKYHCRHCDHRWIAESSDY